MIMERNHRDLDSRDASFHSAPEDDGGMNVHQLTVSVGDLRRRPMKPVIPVLVTGIQVSTADDGPPWRNEAANCKSR